MKHSAIDLFYLCESIDPSYLIFHQTQLFEFSWDRRNVFDLIVVCLENFQPMQIFNKTCTLYVISVEIEFLQSVGDAQFYSRTETGPLGC